MDRSLDIYLDALNKKPKDTPKDVQLLKIGALAKAPGETTSTLRHWTKEGLLEAGGYTDTGYILYSQDMVERIKHIRALQTERLTLDEIKQHLLMAD